MGASIYWRPAERASGHHLNIGLRSRFVAEMALEFGSYPWVVGTETLPRLYRVCNLLESEDASIGHVYTTIADAVSRHGEIEIEVEY